MKRHAGEFYIGGAWVAPCSSVTKEVVNPANGRIIGDIAMGSSEDANRAVEAARAALDDFRRLSKTERLDLLAAIAQVYERRMGDLAEAMTLEMGAPKEFSLKQQAQSGLDHLRVALSSLEGFEFERMQNTTRIVQEAIGVAVLITPWNWPMNQVVCKVAPAMATGCTMVLKPSELSPYSALVFAEILHEAGVPGGVFNLVNGDGLEVGSTLSSHDDVAVVSITGSNRAGVAVAQTAARTIKRVVQELGGKSANILLDDVDLGQAVSEGVKACFANSGQSCDAPTRMLVPTRLHAAAVEIAHQVAAEFVTGDPMEKGTDLGPLANKPQYDKVSSMIEAGVKEGATLVAGGPGRPERCNEEGFFVRPTIFADVTADMSIAKEEIFGPVLCIMPYESEEEAVSIANESPFGLAAYVQSGNHERACAIARHMQAGQVHINGPGVDLMAPFGGYKQSGNGREYAHWGMHDFLETKALIGYGQNSPQQI